MNERYRDEPRPEEVGGFVAMVVVVLVLAGVVVLFLLFKFNFFNGGTSVDVRTTMPLWRLVEIWLS